MKWLSCIMLTFVSIFLAFALCELVTRVYQYAHYQIPMTGSGPDQS